jgi:opacity protein-like surface antigen
MSKTLLLFFVCALAASTANCQVSPAATYPKYSFQLGGEFSIYKPDYGPQNLYGFGAYADLDSRRWIGIEAEGRALFLNKYGDKLQMYTGGGGPRVFYRYHKFVPYAKAVVEFGSITFPNHPTFDHATMVLYGVGGGADYNLSHRVSLRGEFQWQSWPDFLGRGLNPYGANIGAAYRFF